MPERMREAIVLAPELKERLLRLRLQTGRTHDPVIAASAIAAMEEAKRVVLRGDVLAHVAALGLGDEGRRLYDVVHGLEDEIEVFYATSDPPRRGWRGSAKFDHVVFDAWGDWPRFYGVCARDSAAERPFAVLDLKSGAFFDQRFASLADYLDWRWGGSPAEASAAPAGDDAEPVGIRAGSGDYEPPREHADLGAPIDPAALAAFSPAILHEAPPAARHVQHAKFGRGVVVREGEGKLDIDFGVHGVKRLAASFVTDVA